MTRSTFPLSLSIVALLFACGAPPDPHAAEHAAMMKADSATRAQAAAQEAAFRKVFEMFNTGDTKGIEDLLTADFMDHLKDPSITTTGVQGARDMVALIRTAMPDFHQEWLNASTTGDRIYVHYHMTGTNTGAFGAMPATGKAMDILGVDVVRFADGRMAEHWGYYEEGKLMQQLGLMPGAEEKK